MKILILIALIFTGCATTPPCDPEKVVTEWEPWKAEVKRILCAEIQVCSEDTYQALVGADYGYDTELFVKEFTPCRAAQAIIKRKSETRRADTTQKFDEDGNPSYGQRRKAKTRIRIRT